MPSLPWKIANRALAPFGCELRAKARVEPQSFTMDAALSRIAARGTEVATVFDIGAAEGRWTRKALRHFPTARFALVEPLLERRPLLEALCAAQPNVSFHTAAAGEREGTTTLNVTPDLDGSGIYGDSRGSAQREVPLTTIDAEVRRQQLPAPYLVKLDTHGFELPILAGAQETLRQTAAVLLEAYNFQLSDGCLRFAEMCAHMETIGFRCADLADPLLRPGDHLLWQLDLVYLPKDAPVFQRTRYHA